MGISFDIPHADRVTVTSIALRAHELEKDVLGAARTPILDMEMDITATHANCCPLRLADLLDANDADFAHDVFGIARHLDRSTGKLTGMFVPRFAQGDFKW